MLVVSEAARQLPLPGIPKALERLSSSARSGTHEAFTWSPKGLVLRKSSILLPEAITRGNELSAFLVFLNSFYIPAICFWKVCTMAFPDFSLSVLRTVLFLMALSKFERNFLESSFILFIVTCIPYHSCGFGPRRQERCCKSPIRPSELFQPGIVRKVSFRFSLQSAGNYKSPARGL